MQYSNRDASKVPGFPFRVPPPFPGPQLRTLIPTTLSNNGATTLPNNGATTLSNNAATTLSNNGAYKMIEARSVPQLNHLRRPQVSLGCAWDPFTRRWTISDDDQDLHRKMVQNFQYGAGSLLRDYLVSVESVCDMKSTDLMAAQITVKLSSKSTLGLGKVDSSIITIGETESEDEIPSSVELKKDQLKENSDVESGSENGLLVISSVEEDLIEKILIYLDPLSLKRIETTCSSLRNLIDSKNIWQKLIDRISKSDQHFNLEWKKKLALNSSSKRPPRIAHKKTLLQLERSCSNLRQGFGYLKECPQLKRGERWDKIVCNEQFISESIDSTILVMGRRGEGEIRLSTFPFQNIRVIGFVKNILVAYNGDQNLIILIQISTDQDVLGDMSTTDFIGPIVGGVKGLHLARNYLAVWTNRGRIEIYQISGNSYQPCCEVGIPLGHTVPCGQLVDWPGIDIGGGKVFVSLRKNEAQRFHVDKFEGKVMSIDLDGRNTGFIHGLQDPTEGIVSLKYMDGFLYVVTRKNIQVWNHIRKELVCSKKVDITTKSIFRPKSILSDLSPCWDIFVELNDSVLVIVCGSVLSVWDRKECEKERGHPIQKYSSGSGGISGGGGFSGSGGISGSDGFSGSSKLGAFARNIMSATDRSLLWKVQLSFQPASVLLEARKITFLPRFQTESVMVFDFWC